MLPAIGTGDGAIGLSIGACVTDALKFESRLVTTICPGIVVLAAS